MKKTILILWMLLVILCQSFLTGCDTGASDPFQFNSDELAQYVIIYEESNPDYFDLANQLADHIFEKYGKIFSLMICSFVSQVFSFKLGRTSFS